MAATVKNSLQFFLEMLRKEHGLENDTLKVALMVPSFSFDETIHGTWADVSADEIAGGNGYTAGGQTLANVAASINTADKRVEIDADNPSWTASGGAIATTGSAIVYNDTHASKTVVLHIQFEANYDTPDTKVLQINLSNGLRWHRNQAA